MFKKNTRTLLTLLMAFGLCLTSCSDNDLADNTGGSDNGNDPTVSILTEKQAKKYYALQCLLGMTAELDSLPQNWDDNAFTVEPTLGSVADASQPYVRYVATTSAEEANRTFRAMTSTKVEAKATNDTWQLDGVGSMNFNVLNQTDCYATIDLNVQQLPHLTQLRFVPASAIGNNVAPTDKPFYHVGDVIRQQADDGKETFWVCVRPCSQSAEASKSHWCTLQLNPLGTKDANYARLTKKQKSDIILPTALCKDQGDGERMVQNYFNVLRVMESPDLYAKDYVTNIGEITKASKELTNAMVRDMSYIWREHGIWNKLSTDKVVTGLREELRKESPRLNAFYYGYNKVFWGKGDYRVYNLELSVNNNLRDEEEHAVENPGLFNEVDKQILWLEFASSAKEADFSNFENRAGYDGVNLYNEDNTVKNCSEQQYIVKYKTGAQLEKNWLKKNDNTPSASFEKRGNNYGITDVVSYTNLIGKKASDEGGLPFFAFGDEVCPQSEMAANMKYFCIKDACGGDAQSKGTAYFLRETEGQTKGTMLSNNMALYVTFQLLNAYYCSEKGKSIYEPEDCNIEYDNRLLKLWYIFSEHKGLKFSTTTNEKGANIYTMEARLQTSPDNLDVEGKMRYPTVVRMEYNARTGQFAYNMQIDRNATSSDFLKVDSYQDVYTYTESYSKGSRTLPSTGETRKQLKQNVYSLFEQFLQHAAQK